MEARLTDLSCQPPLQVGIQIDHGADGSLPFQPATETAPPQSRLLSRIDRYLRAAGADDGAMRARVAAAAARDLLARGLSAEANWAEIVAAIDRSLAAELSPEGMTLPRARGRLALALAGRSATGEPAKATAAFCGPDWGVPRRRYQAMRGQNLSPWRPRLERLLRLRLSRPAQGVAACLCWIAVLIVP